MLRYGGYTNADIARLKANPPEEQQAERLKKYEQSRQAQRTQRSKEPKASREEPTPKVHEPTHDDFQLPPRLAFYLLFASHILAALYHPIQDCDEVFNYWEPTHYLTHGHGFQTWEYSPVYAIRSWTYAALHALASLHGRVFNFGYGKQAEFYALRITLGAVCASCETRLFRSISATMNPRIGIMFLIIMATSPGMFHASISYLPSSFTMYTTMLGIAAFMDWRGGLRTSQGVFAIGAGAILGWPFAAAMAIPFLLEETLFATLSDAEGRVEYFWRITRGTVLTLIVLGIQMGIDAFFYKKAVVVPFNIVRYNLFSSSGGPNIYGTEPADFYLRNLGLNFHVWFLLAFFSMPIMITQAMSGAKGATKTSYIRGFVFLLPFYLWLMIFTAQPHKEERFMYPLYPALALNAAMTFHILLANFGSTDPEDSISNIPVQLRLFVVLVFVVAGLALSAFRTMGTITAFSAPLSVYSPLHQPNVTQTGDALCLGKEWYRFPSHYLLPEGLHAKFIKSEFSGLLPGEFHPAAPGAGFGAYPGTYLEPAGMNDQNKEDLGKYTDIKHCTFLVDSHMPSTEITALEPNYIADMEHWERIRCLHFMDTAASGNLGRLGWLPDWDIIPAKYKRVYGEYCLLKRKKRETAGTKINPVPHIETLG